MGHYVVIGGGGYLGAHVISWLQKQGCQQKIVIVDPSPRKFATVPLNMEFVTYIKESFLDLKVLDRILPGASSVFHLAAIGHTGIAADDKQLVHEFNVTGTRLLVEKCKEHKVGRFVFASSVAVTFIGKPLYNVTENEKLPDPKNYMNHYSASKAEAENYVLSQSSPKFKTVCLRFRAIYGPEDPNVTEKVVNLIKMGLFIGMVSIHGRESISAASSVVNCAKAFYLADKMLQNRDGLHGRVYYILDGENCGQYQFWSPLVLALGRKPPKVFIPYKLMSTLLPTYEFLCYRLFGSAPVMSKFDLTVLATDNTYSIERARRELGYEPEPCFMTATAEYYRMMTQRNSTKSLRKPTFHQVMVIFCVIFFIWFLPVLFTSIYKF